MIDLLFKTIRYSFYALFLITPLVFTNNTSELFELNKMWVAWGLSAIIVGAWIGKMILSRDFRIKRTPLDIPILIFLISQIISTIFSLDQRVSFFGYYSRFNGGLLSIASYIALFYAFASNLSKENALSMIKLGIISGIIVALWGLPSHFGYDPTCLLFRGSLDVSCWTDAFKPTIRIFSMLGQPAWLASFLALLIPLALAPLVSMSEKKSSIRDHFTDKRIVILFIVVLLFYADLLFANTRAGFLAIWAGLGVFWALHLWRTRLKVRKILPIFLITTLSFFIMNGIFGTPIPQLSALSLTSLNQKPAPAIETTSAAGDQAAPINDGINITDSADIRVLVWEGAIKAWKASPVIGSGLETFAYAYYAHRPDAHNMTSEWDYLYNKAHNEYLNYLTTSGLLGLISYLAVFALFFFYALKKLLRSTRNIESQDFTMGSAIFASVATILIANFFGFSVVITNIYLFFLPLFFFLILDQVSDKYIGYKFETKKHESVNAYQWTGLIGICLAVAIAVYLLTRFWQADIAYALGNNLNKVGDYQNAYPNLTKAHEMRKNEPVFTDELSVNLATLSTALYQNQQATTSSQLAQQAIALSDEVVTNHPNNVVFWKSRTRIFYLLGQINPSYLTPALEAIKKAQKLAPTDAKVSYNVGVLQGQVNQPEEAVKTLTETIRLKKDYRDAYYARGLFYRQLGSNPQGAVINQELAQKAAADMRYILKNLSPTDTEATKTLTTWNESLQ